MYVKLKTIKQFKFTGIIYYKWIIISHSITKISSDSCTEVTECGNGPVWRRLGCGEGYYSHEGSINGVNMPSIKRSKLLMSHDTISFQGLQCCCFFMYYNRGTTHEKKIGAILGTDLTIYYFNQLLEDKYPFVPTGPDTSETVKLFWSIFQLFLLILHILIEILWNYNKTMFVSILLERSTFYFDVSFKYPFCLSLAFSCIIIDNSGFLVMHPHFIETESLKGQNHIAYLVSRCTLIITLSPLTCLNIQNGCLFRYSLKIPSEIQKIIGIWLTIQIPFLFKRIVHIYWIWVWW